MVLRKSIINGENDDILTYCQEFRKIFFKTTGAYQNDRVMGQPDWDGIEYKRSVKPSVIPTQLKILGYNGFADYHSNLKFYDIKYSLVLSEKHLASRDAFEAFIEGNDSIRGIKETIKILKRLNFTSDNTIFMFTSKFRNKIHTGVVLFKTKNSKWIKTIISALDCFKEELLNLNVRPSDENKEEIITWESRFKELKQKYSLIMNFFHSKSKEIIDQMLMKIN